jgi:rare lipoprotein A
MVAGALAACLLGQPVAQAVAAPSTAQTAADRARVDRAVARYETARVKAARVSRQLRASAAQLDDVVRQERATQRRLNARAQVMYRSGGVDLLSVLLGATSFEEFAARWDLLVRMGREDALDLQRLRKLHASIERSADSMLDLQSQQAKLADEIAGEVAAAQRELASSQASLAAYRKRTAPPAPAAHRPVAKRSDPMQRLRGSGEWKTGVASHYGRNFTGRGASGERIGPYSMIVAHRTLPFGTLVEFEYGGKRAVARVADRGPHVAGREFDLGPGVARVLNFSGVHQVRYRVIGR